MIAAGRSTGQFARYPGRTSRSDTTYGLMWCYRFGDRLAGVIGKWIPTNPSGRVHTTAEPREPSLLRGKVVAESGLPQLARINGLRQCVLGHHQTNRGTGR